MILLIECKVDSDTLIDNIIEWRVNNYVFKLYPNDNNKFGSITVESKFQNYQDHTPKVTIENHKISTIEFPEENFYPEQLSMLQYIESFSALDLGVRKIHWDNPTINWIAESDEERIAIKGYAKTMDYPANNRKITLGWFQDTIIHRRMVGHLTEPLSFYRIGVNHYNQHSYIQAFLHFYLMLEGVFGNGNTNKKILIGAFMDAAYLTYGIENVLKSFDNPVHKKHKDWFDRYSFINNEVNKDPLRKMINIFFDERGKLAHFSNNKNDRRRNNFEERKYQSLAAISMMVCHFCSIKLRLDPFIKK